jgi:hypothetical protein
MKLKIINTETPGPVIRRFPYLETELQEMAEKNESFRQLCQDYKDLVSALKRTSANHGDTRSDLLGLKTTLEVEILEQVSRKGASERN